MTPEQREALRPYNRAFQIAVAEIANRKMGIAQNMPQGIFKYEGGVLVNQKEIVIYAEIVREDSLRRHQEIESNDPTPEENATAEAITELSEAFEKSGISTLLPFLPKAHIFMGDPLRRLFDLNR
ncbi:MAG: hypothetical protein PHE27_04575 [Alphaproteobacteria bacterium]|nr:hypothetical protein [Alphaproteobacteria bacterium]